MMRYCLPILAIALSAWSARADLPPASRIIDREIAALLQEHQIKPAEPAEDAELVRRAYLDLLGRIPTPAECEAYLRDTTADKHHQLIDRLLVHDEMAMHWRDVLEVWLNGRPEGTLAPGHAEFLKYLHDSVKANQRWDVLARELLLPRFDEPGQDAAAYFLGSRLRLPKDEQLDGMTVAVARVFFGVRLECAKCHHHPYVSEWKQDHYYGLASFLNRIELVTVKNKPALGERAEGKVTFTNSARDEVPARLMFLDSKVFDEPAKIDYVVAPKGGLPAVPQFSRRQTLADYSFTARNPYFKRAVVNRLWKKLMGRGLVEPVDQIHDANPASHPRLLEELADDFANGGFDLRRLLAGILHSETYRRSSRWSGPDSFPAEELYAVAILKPMTPEQLALSVAQATGQDEIARSKIEREKAQRKIDAVTPALVRAELEKGFYKTFIDRYHSDADGFDATTGQALFMTYNQFTQKFLQPSAGNLVERLVKSREPAAAIRLAYLTVLSRPPAAEEEQAAVDYLKNADIKTAYRNLVWALLNSSEFRFIH